MKTKIQTLFCKVISIGILAFAFCLLPSAFGQVQGWGSSQLLIGTTNTIALDTIQNNYRIRQYILQLSGSNGLMVTGFTANIYLGATPGNTNGSVLLGSITTNNFTSANITNTQDSFTNPPLYIWAQGLTGTNPVYATFLYGPL